MLHHSADHHRRLRAQWRDAQILLRQFRWMLVLFVSVLTAGTFAFYADYHEPLSLSKSLFSTLMLLIAQPVLEFPQVWHLQILFFALPILGLGILLEGVLRFGVMLFNKTLRVEEWQKVLASTYAHHVIVVGLSRIGRRVVDGLRAIGEEVVVVESDAQNEFVEEVRTSGAPVIIGDAAKMDTLRHANTPQAQSLILTGENDLENLEIALNAKELNPDLHVVMRTFNETLADKVSRTFGIGAAFSTSALAAPAFIGAATRKAVTQSFYVDGELFYVAQFRLSATSRLTGQKVGDLEKKLDISIILLKNRQVTDHHPNSDVRLKSEDTVVVLANLEALGRLEEMNG
jgi:Trk K+ transport system NAD-binding subunit